MALERQANFLGEQRLDVPHLRAVESAVAHDFDVLAGDIMGRRGALVVRGFEVLVVGAVGRPANSLQILTAGGILCHPNASDSGSLYTTPSDRPPEVLSVNNPRVRGTFQPSSINFVGCDLLRRADPTTSDQTQFLELATLSEIPKTVPQARTLDYQIVISTLDFASQSNVAPNCIVETDASNNVVSILDARSRLFRLGTGGTAPDAKHSYPWPEGRGSTFAGSQFKGGDKAVGSQKEWGDAVMTRLWEIAGGEAWFSAVLDRNTRMGRFGTKFTNGEYFEWDGTNLHWRGLRFLFHNSTGLYNDVKDQLATSAGLTNLADLECLYVDVDFSQTLTAGSALQAVKAPLQSLGSSVVPGARFVLAWRNGNDVYTRDSYWSVGNAVAPATTVSLGVVVLSRAPSNPALPVVLTDTERNAALGVAALDGARQVIGTGLNRDTSGSLQVGTSVNDQTIFVGSASTTGGVQILPRLIVDQVHPTGFGTTVLFRGVLADTSIQVTRFLSDSSFPNALVPLETEVARDNVCRGWASVIVTQPIFGTYNLTVRCVGVQSVSRLATGEYRVVFQGVPNFPMGCDVQATARQRGAGFIGTPPFSAWIAAQTTDGSGRLQVDIQTINLSTAMADDSSFSVNWKGY